jgi:hypothetical protein
LNTLAAYKRVKENIMVIDFDAFVERIRKEITPDTFSDGMVDEVGLEQQVGMACRNASRVLDDLLDLRNRETLTASDLREIADALYNYDGTAQ